jgi:hypothetical protein
VLLPATSPLPVRTWSRATISCTERACTITLSNRVSTHKQLHFSSLEPATVTKTRERGTLWASVVAQAVTLWRIIAVVRVRYQWPSGLRRRSAADRLLRLRVRIPPWVWMFVLCVLNSKDKRQSQDQAVQMKYRQRTTTTKIPGYVRFLVHINWNWNTQVSLPQ